MTVAVVCKSLFEGDSGADLGLRKKGMYGSSQTSGGVIYVGMGDAVTDKRASGVIFWLYVSEFGKERRRAVPFT